MLQTRLFVADKGRLGETGTVWSLAGKLHTRDLMTGLTVKDSPAGCSIVNTFQGLQVAASDYAEPVSCLLPARCLGRFLLPPWQLPLTSASNADPVAGFGAGPPGPWGLLMGEPGGLTMAAYLGWAPNLYNVTPGLDKTSER